MKELNCLRCEYRHTDNGNCTAVGGFCTAVTAAHCPLLQQYLDTGLTPSELETIRKDADALRRITQYCSLDRLEELAKGLQA